MVGSRLCYINSAKGGNIMIISRDAKKKKKRQEKKKPNLIIFNIMIDKNTQENKN